MHNLPGSDASSNSEEDKNVGRRGFTIAVDNIDSREAGQMMKHGSQESPYRFKETNTNEDE